MELPSAEKSLIGTRKLERSETDEELYTKRLKAADVSVVVPAAVIDTMDKPLKPEYRVHNGIRTVLPYYFKYRCNAKQRWYGRHLIDVLNAELHARAPAFFVRHEDAIRLGRLTVNGKLTTPNHVIKNGDRIENLMHRHESEVADAKIEIIHEDEDVLVVDKPCSLPVHPCGRYRHNSLVYHLRWMYGYDNLKILYRLDRLTSGLLVICRNQETIGRLMSHIRERKVEKEYIARVEGEFPADEVICNEPIGPVSLKMGLYGVRSPTDSKPSRTRFQRIATNGKESIVRCFPETGRTHQIRVHLQYLGFPITNDLVYNRAVWGPQKGKSGEYGKSHEQLVSDLWDAHAGLIYLLDVAEGEDGPDVAPTMPTIGGDGCSENAPDAARVNASSTEYDPTCFECRRSFQPRTIDELRMFLHCVRYKGPDWEYATRMPAWTDLEVPAHVGETVPLSDDGGSVRE